MSEQRIHGYRRTILSLGVDVRTAVANRDNSRKLWTKCEQSRYVCQNLRLEVTVRTGKTLRRPALPIPEVFQVGCPLELLTAQNTPNKHRRSHFPSALHYLASEGQQ